MLHVLETRDMNHGVSKKNLKMEGFPTEIMSLPLPAGGLQVIILTKSGEKAISDVEGIELNLKF